MATKISVVGCGALGLNYGTRLLEAQLYHDAPLDVSLVVRRDYDLIMQAGIRVDYGKAHEEKQILHFPSDKIKNHIFCCTKEVVNQKGTMDWVIVCCKSYSIDEQLHKSLIPLIGADTKIIVIMNGLGVEEPFIKWFGSERIYGGLSQIACNRGPNPPLIPGSPLLVNVYLDLKLHLAHVSDNIQLSQHAVDLFKHTTLSDKVGLSTNLLRTRWDKLTWNLTFAGIAVALGGLTCDVIVQDPALRLLATSVITDVIRVANADIKRQFRERHGSEPVPTGLLLDETDILEEIWVRTANAGAYKSSTVLDLVAGRPLEMQYLFGVPLERARQLQEQDPSVHYSHLHSIVLMVEAVSRLGAQKASMGVAWQPTYFSDELHTSATSAATTTTTGTADVATAVKPTL